MLNLWRAALCVAVILFGLPVRADELVGDESQAAIPKHWPAAKPIGGDAGPVTPEMLAAPNTDASRWISYHGDTSSIRHSPIRAFTRNSVKRLRPAWLLPTGTTGQFGVSPLVYDGVMYVTPSYKRLYAVDAASGQVLWR